MAFVKAVDTHTGGSVKLTNTGLLTIAAPADFTLDGLFNQAGSGGTSLAGDITTTNDAIDFHAAVQLTHDVVLTSAGGNVRFNGVASTVDGDYLLTIHAGAGNINFDAAVGTTTPLSGLVVTSGTLTVASTLKADDQ